MCAARPLGKEVELAPRAVTTLVGIAPRPSSRRCVVLATLLRNRASAAETTGMAPAGDGATGPCHNGSMRRLAAMVVVGDCALINNRKATTCI